MPEFPFSTPEVLVLLGLGGFAGLLGGLIGVGGGFVLVPGLFMLFSHHPEFSADALSLTLGTTMGCILFTAAGSAFAQYRRGAVELALVRRMAPWVVPATAFGSAMSVFMATGIVRAAFAVFCLYSATRMAFFSATMAQPGLTVQETPAAGPGLFFGAVCGLLAVGGANLFVPFMLKRNVDARTAMGTASALQLPIALAGTVAYIAAGWGDPSVPWGSFGYVHLPALLVLAGACLGMAPLGVRATHALPVLWVKRFFAGFTALAGFKMMGVLPF